MIPMRFGSRSCSASLLSNQTAVTAASCFLDEKGELMRYYDNIRLYIDSGVSRHMDLPFFGAHLVHFHPSFSTVTLENDIAIIKLDYPVPKDTATPVAIYSGNVTDDMSLVTAGWGSTSTGISGVPSDILNTATQSPSSSSVCKDANVNWSDNNKNIVCTLVKDDKGLVYDGGGNPLAFINNRVSLIVGIANTVGKSKSSVTIRPEDAVMNYYTHVYSYIDWIVSVTGLEKPYLLNTTARTSPEYSTITGILTNGNFSGSNSTPTILQNTGFILVMLLSSMLALLF
ncbi:Chymotrypsin B [Zancudomyces culisetae]|uniref:Chymotrypsin B n=1 Tax=Zancudomyces culisetae TaxID=1213189 RepID=A0A1R1PGN6_ZANCU|nr:Chymotrypsin B [Zancudomyces culisetae]|eukprot:OMH80098.1 Chymotrypsin B [Zancudomyces culisetae]